MKRGIDALGEHDSADRQAERAQHGDHEQLDTVGRRGLEPRDGRIEHPKLLPLLALLHAFGKLGLLVALQQRLIELTRAVVVAGEFAKLLFPPRHVLNPGLIARDGILEALLFSFENFDVFDNEPADFSCRCGRNDTACVGRRDLEPWSHVRGRQEKGRLFHERSSAGRARHYRPSLCLEFPRLPVRPRDVRPSFLRTTGAPLEG